METKYEMPVLTKKQREEVMAFADFCKGDKGNPSSIHFVCQIALVALTAGPVYQFIANNPDHDGYIEWADCNPDYYSKEPSDRRRILYTAPPVPSLKLPEESDLDPGALVAIERRISFMNGARFAIGEIKRMSGVTE